MSKLVVFDIDGTLTDTNAVDDELFSESVADALQLPLTAVDWSDAPHITDEGIFNFICDAHGCQATPSAKAYARSRLTSDLEEALRMAPQRFLPIAGAPFMIRSLLSAGWYAAFATGCWSDSARIKLRAAGIEFNDAVLASADDAIARTDIVRNAVARASAFFERTFQRIVVIGDGAWDVAAARELRLPFIGIGTGRDEVKLRAEGARTVLPDYADVRGFLDQLETAIPPGDRTSRAAGSLWAS